MIQILVLSLLIASIAAQRSHVVKVEGYSAGQNITIECLNHEKQWGKGPICMETGEELIFSFGRDGMIRCEWYVTKEMYQYLSRLIQAQESWNCRVASNPGEYQSFIPFTIPIWGVVENDHIHVDNHLNFVFHVDFGFIIGIACYPVRDFFEMARTGSVLHMHGAVRWFRRHTFDPYFGNLAASFWQEFRASLLQILLIGLLVILVVFNGFFMFYWVYLKPRILKKIQSKPNKPVNKPASLSQQQLRMQAIALSQNTTGTENQNSIAPPPIQSAPPKPQELTNQSESTTSGGAPPAAATATIMTSTSLQPAITSTSLQGRSSINIQQQGFDA